MLCSTGQCALLPAPTAAMTWAANSSGHTSHSHLSPNSPTRTSLKLWTFSLGMAWPAPPRAAIPAGDKGALITTVTMGMDNVHANGRVYTIHGGHLQLEEIVH